jgi:gamma-glutamyltranspeptidase
MNKTHQSQSNSNRLGAVTSPHLPVSEIGAELIRRGANAVEAAIAMGCALNVTYPHFTGFGGDAFLILHSGSGRTETISGIGQSGMNVNRFRHAIPIRGPESMLTTAALVDALGLAVQWSQQHLGGRRSFGDLLEPAIGLARGGFETSPSQAFWTQFRQNEMNQLPGVRDHFLIDAASEYSGRHFFPSLAKTLETLQRNGYRDFYEGEIAASLARELHLVGSVLTAEDLRNTRARLEAPLQLAYRGGTLLAHQPPTQGITTLQIMGLLREFDFQKIEPDGADYFHLLLEAIKIAFLDRNHCLADPEFSTFPFNQLLSSDSLKKQSRNISMTTAAPWGDAFKTGDTVFIGAVDRWGNAASVLQTIYYDWGSGVYLENSGMLWHNRGAAFGVNPTHPNCLEPCKRPFHTLNPGMYLKGGQVELVYGTQGADGQPQTLATILPRLIDYSYDPLQALSAPRFLLGKTFSDSRDSVKIEIGSRQDLLRDLRRKGHTVAELPLFSPICGHAGVIKRDLHGDLLGAHDPRSDGCAVVI